MKIVCTLSYILNNCNNWLAFCDEYGYDEYCCCYGGDTEITLTKDEAIKYKLI